MSEISEEVDNRYRSRKFILACVYIAVATITMLAGEYALHTLVAEKILDPENYRLSAIAVLYWWLFCDLGVLGGYGVPNVIEKWSPKGGGA